MEEGVGGEKVTQIGVGGVRFKGELGKLDIIWCIGWGYREGEGERYVEGGKDEWKCGGLLLVLKNMHGIGNCK